ncbi:hypothetical protein [Granulibacter bethesdensis]|uniref:hypothetical protein n=1 Tax=Granulibacter bethesdensis TaxID=364410 RepID=UPI0012FE666F|nr:hypothetical protein [Granulibacter bethesdensis]
MKHNFFYMHPLQEKEEGFYLCVPGYEPALLRTWNGVPIAQFNAGWKVVSLCTLFEPVWFLIFTDTINYAAWQVSPDGICFERITVNTIPDIKSGNVEDLHWLPIRLSAIHFWVSGVSCGRLAEDCPADVVAYSQLPLETRKLLDLILDKPITGLLPEPLSSSIFCPVVPITCEENIAGAGLKLSQNGREVVLPPFNGGWLFSSIDVRLAPLILVELRHEDGLKAWWYVDWSNSAAYFILSSVPEAIKEILAFRVEGFFEQIWDEVIGHKPAQALSSFCNLPEEILNTLLHFWWMFRTNKKNTDIIYSDAKESDLDGRYRGIPVSRGLIALESKFAKRALVYPFYSQIDRLLQEGVMSWPSPVSNRLARCDGKGVFFGRNLLAYKFYEPADDLVFYILCGEAHFCVVGLYIPCVDLLIAEEHRVQYLKNNSYLPRIGFSLMHHCLRFVQKIYDGYSKDHRKADVHLLFGVNDFHIGHYIWQDLSGLDKIQKNIKRSNLPLIHRFSSKKLYFGREENIFPACRDLFQYHDCSYDDYVAAFYENGSTVVIYTDMYIADSIGRQIKEIAYKSPDLEAEIQKVDAALARHTPIVIIGLRTVNRTVNDPEGYVCATLKRLAKEFPGCTVILDGNNSLDDTGHGAEILDSATQQEISIAITAKMIAGDLPIYFYDIINRSPLCSVLWGGKADCFIAPWGAALAKYRWICNLPGLVFSSAQNLRERGDIIIYHDQKFMENGSPLFFVNPDYVQDLDEEEKWTGNFVLDMPAVLDQFIEIVNKVLISKN